MSEMIHVQVLYALPREQDLIDLELAKGCTVEQAIQISGILSRHQDIDLVRNKVGIFSKPTTLDTILQEGDRVEIYRGLIADPQTARRKRKEPLIKEGLPR